MTLLEKIESWIIPNTSRLISALKLREILIDVANGLSGGISTYASEVQTQSFLTGSGYEVDITHSLDTPNIDVSIYIDEFPEIQKVTNFRVFIRSNSEITIVKDSIGVWIDARVIIQKIH
jgi:hypothetical protein